MNHKILQLTSNSSLDLGAMKDSHLLVDTNFLLDAVTEKKAFLEVTEHMKKSGIPLVGIDAVKYEFTRGSNIEQFTKRTEFYNSLISTDLSVDSEVITNAANLARVLLHRSQSVSYTDILILATLVKYSDSKLFLISSDRTDIPSFLFPQVYSIVIDTGKTNRFYSIYRFDKIAYSERLEELTGK